MHLANVVVFGSEKETIWAGYRKAGRVCMKRFVFSSQRPKEPRAARHLRPPRRHL
jgi:hypothetical protein